MKQTTEDKMLTKLMELADRLAADAIENGGATLATATATPITNGYTIGGGIINTADAMSTIPATINQKKLAAAIYGELLKNRKQLATFKAVGVWNSNGVVYLDAVTIESKLIQAVVKGLTRKQQAIGSLKDGIYEEITL